MQINWRKFARDAKAIIFFFCLAFRDCHGSVGGAHQTWAGASGEGLIIAYWNHWGEYGFNLKSAENQPNFRPWTWTLARSWTTKYLQSCVWRLPKYWPPPPSPPSECVSPAPKAGDTYSPAVRGMGGQYFGRRQTRVEPFGSSVIFCLNLRITI